MIGKHYHSPFYIRLIGLAVILVIMYVSTFTAVVIVDIVLSVLRFTASGYPFGIIKLFYIHSLLAVFIFQSDE